MNSMQEMGSHKFGRKLLLAIVAIALVTGAFLLVHSVPQQEEKMNGTVQEAKLVQADKQTDVGSQEEEQYKQPSIVRTERPLKLIREWKHPNGTSVRFFEKDLFTMSDPYDATSTEEIIQLVSSTSTIVLYHNTRQFVMKEDKLNPDTGEFSPLGNFFAIKVWGYESSPTLLFDLSNGRNLFAYEDHPLYRYDTWPYWSPNESILVIGRDENLMDGSSAAVFVSTTGKIEDAKLIFDGTSDGVMLKGQQATHSLGELKDVLIKDGKVLFSVGNSIDHFRYEYNIAIGTLKNELVNGK